MTIKTATHKPVAAKDKKRTAVPAAKTATTGSTTAVDALEIPAGVQLLDIPIDAIDAHPDNPRKALGDLGELADSIREQGVLEPVLLVPGIKGTGTFPQRYVSIAGHRRIAAARLAGLPTVPSIVRELTPAKQLEVMLVENLHSSDLTVFEEAHGMQALFELGVRRAEIAKHTGRHIKTVGQRLALAALPSSAEVAVANRKMTIEVALELGQIRDRDEAVYGELVKQLDEGKLQGWAISSALSKLERIEDNKNFDAELEEHKITAILSRDEIPSDALPIGDLGIELADHMGCPGALVSISHLSEYYTKRESTSGYCTAAEKHHKAEYAAYAAERESNPNAHKPSRADREKEHAERQARNAVYSEATKSRWSWISHLLANNASEHAVARRNLIEFTAADMKSHAIGDYGLGAPADGIEWPTDHAAAFALAIIYDAHGLVPDDEWGFERLQNPPDWFDDRDEIVARILGFWKALETAGYTLTDIEVAMREALSAERPVDEGADGGDGS
jgi:ParB/RepB/Spo0J family partition protein